MLFLRQSTAVDVLIGPFLSDSDGKTPATSGSVDVELSKNGQALGNKNDGDAPAHEGTGSIDGYFNCELDTTDTNTVGHLRLVAHLASHLPIWQDFQVVEEAIYDALFAASADLITKVDAIDTVVDAVLVDTGTTLDGKLDTIDNFLDTEVAAILADTNELQGDWVNGGRLDLILDGILADTGELQTDWANGGRLDLLVDSIIAGVNVTTVEGVDATNAIQTSASASLIAYNLDHLMKTAVADNADMSTEVPDGTVLSNLMTKTGDTSDYAYATDSLEGLAGVWTTAQTESYASDGSAATPAQLMYMIYTCVAEFAVSGTTLTAKKLDGSTTAMTFTLNDASDPTSRTRAT